MEIPLSSRWEHLLGAVIIVVLGMVDDIYALAAKLKLVVQIVAALVAALKCVRLGCPTRTYFPPMRIGS